VSRTGTNPSERTAIGLDVGGTKIAGAVVGCDGEVLDRLVVPTPTAADGAVTIAALLRVVDELRARHPGITAVGIGAAGMVEWPTGHIRWAPNNAYHDVPLRRLVEDATGLPAVVENDANVAAWGESRAGAGRGCPDLLAITVGTGVGGGLVLDGALHRGPTGIGGEVGHIVVDPCGPPCGCGNTGCLEAVASGTALGREGRAAAAADPGGLLAQLAGSPGRVTGRTVHEAAGRGDPAALALFDRCGFWLGAGIASVVNLLESQLIVVGGGLAAAGELLLGPARVSYERFVFARGRRRLAPIVCARLGQDAGVVGAALLALDGDRPAGAAARHREMPV
jgi:glucokinase